MSIFKKTLIFIVVFLALDFLAAKAYNYLHDQTITPARIALEESLVYTDYGVGLRPNFNREVAWGNMIYSLRTNSLGLKDFAVRDIMRKTKKRRVLLLGDSIVQGMGYSFEQTFAGRLAEKWSDCDVELLNGGTQLYGIIAYYLKARYLLEALALNLDEIIVFADITDAFNDVFNFELGEQEQVTIKGLARIADGSAQNYYVTDGTGEVTHAKAIPAPPPPITSEEPVQPLTDRETRKAFLRNVRALLKRNSATINLISKVRRIIEVMTDDRQRYGLGKPESGPIALWTINEEHYNRYGKRGLEIGTRVMDKLFNLARNHGVRLSVVVYPLPDQIYARDLDSKHVRHWQNWSDRNGVRFINFFPEFIKGSNLGAVIAENFIATDMHLNEDGHSRMATLLDRSFPEYCAEK